MCDTANFFHPRWLKDPLPLGNQLQELCTGKTLRENLDRKKFSPEGERLPHVEIAMRLVIDVASGMSHIHSHNIVHGDLKAGNVLLCPSERSGPDRDSVSSKLPSMTAKVADFGLSTKLSEGSTHLSNCYSGTITHMVSRLSRRLSASLWPCCRVLSSYLRVVTGLDRSGTVADMVPDLPKCYRHLR